MGPLKLIILEKVSPTLRVSTHIYGVSKEIDGKMFIFKVNLGMMTPQINHLRKNESCSEGFNTHSWGFQGDRWENIHFLPKPRHVTPQIDHLRKMMPCSEGFNTHLWGFQGDRWENIHFASKPRHVTPQIDHLGKTSPTLRVSTHFYGDSKEIDGKMFIFRVNLSM